MSTNPDSILDTVKKTLGFDAEYTAFDLDIVVFINAAFGSLQQFGVGSDTGFIIQDNTTLWSQYIADLGYLGMVKQYIFQSVKMAFDPPATSFAIDAVTQQLLQLGWRINVAVEALSPPSDPFATDTPVVFEQSKITFFAVKVVQLSFASVITPDASLGNTFYLTLTGDCTLNAPVNGVDGEHINVELKSNGHGVTWGAGWNWGSAGEPDLSPASTDIISSIYSESDAEWFSGFTAGF
jgi:hypothetical protein